MKRTYIFSSVGVLGAVAVAGGVWQATDRVLRSNASVGEVTVGGSPREEAAKSLRTWWTKKKANPLVMTINGKPVMKLTPTNLGVRLDDVASVGQIPDEGAITQSLGGSDSAQMTYPPVYITTAITDPKALEAKVSAFLPKPSPAKVTFVKGKIVKGKETPTQTVDLELLPAAAVEALKANKSSFELPLKQAPKKITDEMLSSITDVVAEFSTRFSAGNVPRASNIRLAASKINGVILLPGEVFSYNDTVGRRTLKAGFRTAGVYINGRHDTGVGGGICQVSTTLYNAALFANLGIKERQNHSMPVPYVPVGRDATVDYGNIDLKLENTTENPIVLASTYTPGKLTFRILGKKTPGLSVSVVGSGVSAGGVRTQRVVDRSIPAGTTRVRERGSARLSTSTTRIVKVNGEVVKREGLGRSYYAGGLQVIAYNPDKPAPKPPKAAAAPKPTAPAPALAPSDPTE